MTQHYGQTATQTYAPAYGQTATQTQGQGRNQELYVLDDRDILTDLLLCAKQLLSAYGTAAIECTNPQLRQTLQQIGKTESEFHTKVFDMMHQRGWYQTPKSDAQLAGQIASVWTQQLQRTGGANHQQYGQRSQQQQSYMGSQPQTQSWQPPSGGASPWPQHNWGGQGGEQWNQSGHASWRAGHAASTAWDSGRSPGSSPSPGAHT